MRRIARSVFTEVYFWGCNPSFVVTDDGVVMIDTPQQPIDALRWRERMLEHGPIRHLVNTEPPVPDRPAPVRLRGPGRDERPQPACARPGPAVGP